MERLRVKGSSKKRVKRKKQMAQEEEWMYGR